ncbi:MAG: DUF1802 family protein [Candidatus Omnitrophota bacterium]
MKIESVDAKTGSLALKEWAVICQALVEGKQTILFTKGSAEEREFLREGQEFLLYPSLERQTREDIKPECQDFFRRYTSFDEEEFIPISHCGRIIKAVPVPSLQSLNALSPRHIWANAYLEKLWNEKPEKALQLLVVRVYKLSKGRFHDYEEQYAGSKSWVSLTETIPTENAKPVLTDADFQKKVAEFKV